MSLIRQLSPHVADLIAAGEVVERPGSVVKELLENAVDAGARRVTVEAQNGGMTFLRVTDDGCGMDPGDAETAFLRHATSKLREAEDLAAISTMGFRGEALAAIASVSRMDLMTRTAGSNAGTSVHLEGGTVTERGPAGCPVGTTMIVRDLFYNTPARMKFMKSDSAESAYIASVVQQQALAHPGVAMRLLRDGQEVLSTPGDGQLASAVYCVFGRQFARDLVAVESRWEKFTLRGFVTKPAATRGNRGAQHFFVGGRPVKSRLLASALEQAYQNQMTSGRFPGCVLSLEMPPNLLDVNVHPAKTEVRFLKERDVFDAVHYGVLGALSRAPGRPEMELKPKKPAEIPEKPAKPAQNPAFFKTMDAAEYRAFAKTLSEAPRPVPTPETVRQVFGKRPVEPPPIPEAPPEALHLASPAARPKTDPAHPVQTVLPLPETPPYRVIGEALDTYIIVEQGDAVLFLDKHAAHERILFERLRARETELMAQTLMAPAPVQLEREEAAAVLENAALLEKFGFGVEDFGDGAVMVRQLPADLDEGEAETVLQALASDLLEGRTADPQTLRDKLLHTVACKAAIKAGWHTDPQERDDLVRQVLTRGDIQYCPHGRPVIVTLTKSQLERQFKRS